jgi:toxin FitB
MYLVDTNVLSEPARPRPAASVLRFFEVNVAIVISAISIEELAYGIARAPTVRHQKLLAWFEALIESVERVVDVTPEVARTAGELRAMRERAGRPVAQADMLIAASAAVHRLTLVTRNVSDFEGCGVRVLDPFRS